MSRFTRRAEYAYDVPIHVIRDRKTNFIPLIRFECARRRMIFNYTLDVGRIRILFRASSSAPNYTSIAREIFANFEMANEG